MIDPEMVARHDKLLKDVLRKYGVPEDELAPCVIEILLVVFRILKEAKNAERGRTEETT